MIEKYSQYFEFSKIEEVMQYLDFLKKNKYSRLLDTILEKMFSALKSDKFSPLTRKYFAQINSEGEPFVYDNQSEPDKITQVKKIINALYHARVALNDIEKVDLRGNKGQIQRIHDLELLYHRTFDHTYKACYLATHLDVDFSEMFSQELAVLIPLMTKFEDLAKVGMGEVHKAVAQMDAKKITHQAGFVAGVVIDQLGPQSGKADIEFLTRFSAVLPDYLGQLSGLLEKCTAQVSEHAPGIDKQKLEKLQNDAIELLQGLRKTRNKHMFLPLEALYYIHLLSQLTSLALSIYEEAGHLSETSQDTIRHYLAKLKYDLLPKLFSFIDKIEVDFMLKPGTLSKPIMEKASYIYELITDLSNKFVNFSVKGQTLPTIEDSKFNELRLENTYQRMAFDQAELLKLETVKDAAAKFFRILSQPQFADRRLISLNEHPQIKEDLRTYYKQMEPYVVKFNVPLNNLIIGGLTNAGGILDAAAAFFSFESNTDSVHNVLSLRPALEAYLNKLSSSLQFKFKLNTCLIDAVHKDVANLKLSHYESTDHPFIYNEAARLKQTLLLEQQRLNETRPLTEEQDLEFTRNEVRIGNYQRAELAGEHLANIDDLSKEEILRFYQQYKINAVKLEKANEAYYIFNKIISAEGIPPLIQDISAGQKRILRNLYSVFRPYISGFIRPELDKAMVFALDSDRAKAQLGNVFTSEMVAINPRLLRNCFAPARTKFEHRGVVFSTKLKQLIPQESWARPLIPEVADHNKKADFVLKSHVCSQAISEFRQSLYKFTASFNNTVQSQLHKAPSGIPFPELEDYSLLLAESSQVRSIKQLFNCLYNLEIIMANVESLNDKSYQSVYVVRVIQIGIHVRAASDLIQALINNPAVSVLMGEILEKWQKCKRVVDELHRNYVPMPLEGEIVDASSGHGSVLFYSMNVLQVLPAHIQAMRGNLALTTQEINALHQHAASITADIERIIAKRNSYLRLFLEIPTVFRLFTELKTKLYAMAGAMHGAAMDNLAYINDSILSRMLLEADRYEDNLGLIPGTLSTPLKSILDTFYQGLLKPLGLHSSCYISLATSSKPMEQRLSAVHARIVEANRKQQDIEDKREPLLRFILRINEYKACVNGAQHLIPIFKDLLIAEFRSILPLLQEMQPLVETHIPVFEADPLGLDALLNGQHNASRLEKIETLTKACASYWQGLYATEELSKNAFEEKLGYLDGLKNHQEQTLNTVIVEDYIRSSFDRQSAIVAAKQVGLIHCASEYHEKIMKYLDDVREQLIVEAKQATIKNIHLDADLKVKELLQAKVIAFEQQHYKDFYHLELMMVSIRELKEYLDPLNKDAATHRTLFENPETLADKLPLAQALEAVATDKTRSIQVRLLALKEQVAHPGFGNSMLTQHTHASGTWLWFKQWVVSFLELIGLYTPTHKKCYKELVKATEPPVLSAQQLTEKFGLFAPTPIASPRAYDLPVFDHQQPGLA